MRRSGILHADLSRQIGLLGHGDRVVIGDCGLPLPRTVPVVDLALRAGLLGFREVLDAVLPEIVVEAHVVAQECLGTDVEGWLTSRADLLGARETLSHEALKALLPSAAFAIRTGEATPYANVIVRCGVPF